LVHGAWHGAWCWARVVATLAVLGVPAVAVELPGHGADPGPAADLHGDADRVREVLGTIDGPIVLVGHSYGGAVITEAGMHTAVAHLIYLCALAIDSDESCVSAAAVQAATAGISHEGRPDLGAGFVVGSDRTVMLDVSVAATCLYSDCDDDTTDWAVARLGPQPLITLQQTPDAVAWRSKTSTYVVCANELAKRCTSSVEWQTGHSPFLSRPDLVAGLVARIATSVARPVDGQN